MQEGDSLVSSMGKELNRHWVFHRKCAAGWLGKMGIPAIWYALGMRNKNPVLGRNLDLLYRVALFQRTKRILMKILFILIGLFVLVNILYWKCLKAQ